MSDTKVNIFFISEKLAKIRWVPEQIQQCQRFITGSWDMPANFVRLWHMQDNPYADDINEYVPRCTDKINFNGDISGLEYVDDNTVAVGCGDGYISLLKIERAVIEDQLQLKARSNLVHCFKTVERAAPCTGLATYNEDIATIGEDGRLNILTAEDLKTPKRTIEADSLPLFALAFINQAEVLVANRMGVIRMFDMRAGSDDGPTKSFITSSEDERSNNFVSCLCAHPTQKHVVLAGSEEGSITVWDLRQLGYPASYLSAHTSTITDLGFQQQNPNRLLSAAENGELWHWSQQSPLIDAEVSREEMENIWLNGERVKNKLKVTALISRLRKAINCFDTQGTKIICGGDNEAIYIIDE